MAQPAKTNRTMKTGSAGLIGALVFLGIPFFGAAVAFLLFSL